jgi:predicted regulator of Ras-like GTPase activity (Roadblock/LC7/MglB family)
MKHIFISYSRKNIEWMHKVKTDLESKAFETWTDEELTPGTRAWKLAIQNAIENAGAMVVLMSPDAKASEWVDREVEYARIRNVRIFPLLAIGEPGDAVPLELVNSQWVDVSRPDKYSAGIERLVLALDNHLGVKRKSKAELIREQLLFLSTKLEGIYWIAILTWDGLTVACHDPQGLDEDRISAMNAATMTLGERISSELQGGPMDYVIVKGQTGTQLTIGINEEYVLGFGIKNVSSIDTTLIILRQWWQPLLDLLK